jgi:hypothetical protein
MAVKRVVTVHKMLMQYFRSGKLKRVPVSLRVPLAPYGEHYRVSPIGSILPFCFPILPKMSAFGIQKDKKDLKKPFICMAQFSWYWSSKAFPRSFLGSRIYEDKKRRLKEEAIVL